MPKENPLKTFKKIRKKLAPFFKRVERNPLLMVCKEHKATKKMVKELNKTTSWRGVAAATSQEKCSNQICGWFLCIDAGIANGPWEEDKEFKLKSPKRL